MSIDVPACANCGLTTFPAHLRCSRCGATEWTSVTVEQGELEAVTTVERSLVTSTDVHPRLGSVCLTDGVRIIVRVLGEPAVGATVTLTADGDVVVAVIPGRSRARAAIS
jgi:uncharacterized OB-fold protein